MLKTCCRHFIYYELVTYISTCGFNDFRFGTDAEWKKAFKSEVAELDDEFYHLHGYTEIEYLDINDDFEYIDFIRISILMNSLWRWKKALKTAFPKLDF